MLKNTVDSTGRNPANQLIIVVFPVILQGSLHPRWCRISSINSLNLSIWIHHFRGVNIDWGKAMKVNSDIKSLHVPYYLFVGVVSHYIYMYILLYIYIHLHPPMCGV